LSAVEASARGGPANIAAAAASARLRVAFAPNRPGRRTTIELALRVAGPGGTLPPPLSSFSLRLPAGMGIATTTLGQENCLPARLIEAGLQGCSPNARLGFGSATAVVPVGAGSVAEHAALYPLMGPPREDRVEVLFYVQAGVPVFAQLVLPGVVAEDRSPYGERLETQVPLVQAWPEGPYLALQTFDSTIGPLHLSYVRGRGRKAVHYRPRGIRIPASCPAGGYPFAASLSFVDGTHAEAFYRVPCRGR
jgi:hypothetical protein